MRVSDKRRWYAAYVRRRYPRVWASWCRQSCVVKERMAMRRFHAAAARAMLIYEDSMLMFRDDGGMEVMWTERGVIR